jgi:hypothetical protein
VPANTFEDELAREVLRGEKLRVNILICVILTVVLLLNLLTFVMLAQFQRAFHGNFRAFQLGSTMIGCLLFLYLLGERALITRHLKQGKKLGLFHRYLTAFLETSVPTRRDHLRRFAAGPRLWFGFANHLLVPGFYSALCPALGL